VGAKANVKILPEMAFWDGLGRNRNYCGHWL